MKKITTILLAAFVLMSSCAKKFYTSSAFETAAASHKIIAVVPVQVVLTGKQPSQMTAANVAKQEEAESKAFQQYLYNDVLRYANTKNFYTTVQLQPVETTNRLLNESNISFRDIAALDDSKLCKLLGVDAIVKMTVQKTRYMSGLQSFGADLLNDIIFRNVGVFIPGTVTSVPKANEKTNDISATCSIQGNGTVLWNDNYSGAADWQRSSNEIIENVTSRFAKHFPYRKSKK
jgi:hypothetical protein